MASKEPDPTNFSVVNTLLAAIERGDLDQVRRCFAPSALTWHNFDEIEQDVHAMAAMLGHLCAHSTSRSYEDRRITTVGSQAFLQYTLTAALHSGDHFRMPAMMRLEIGSDGLVARIEEYFDSRVLDSLAKAS
ncbi:nuclear transport factor 2 family protein [Streptomyces sp. NBC_00124]|uniref:nuclear transport factor 2 family protein n=1 Tax=Streptomyces sp. NBC_00124 TaxID=2975662 RepID=UPI002254488F|nr:nuclear transport factor 2 family protein [Streptomyces sp. NBC_00124]MCX5366945.1 nuclear transport factor 2 family protein [Streptomyces sp. NBC_00124]